jgi:hypothetical protein
VSGGTELVSKDYWLLAGDLKDFKSVILPRMLNMGMDLR